MSWNVFALTTYSTVLGMATGCLYTDPNACTLEAVFGVNITLKDSARLRLDGRGNGAASFLGGSNRDGQLRLSSRRQFRQSRRDG